MFSRVSADGWKARWVLDGEMSKEENGNIIKIDEAIVTRGYATYSIAGRYVTEKHKPGYLPAIPLLLLR